MQHPMISRIDAPPPYQPSYQYVCTNPDPPMMMAPVIAPPLMVPPLPQQQQQQQSTCNSTSNTTIVVAGGGGENSQKSFLPFRCPVCSVGVLEERFTCCGIFWAIVLFPIGLICLFLLRERSCNACGYSR